MQPAALALALALLARAAADWVEITQQHPRKPPRTQHYTKYTTPEITHQETSPRNRIYMNQSLDKHWNKGVVHRVPNVGHVKKIYLSTEEPASVKYEETDLDDDNSNDYNIRNSYRKYHERTPEFVTKEESSASKEDIIIHKPSINDNSLKRNEVRFKNNKDSLRRHDSEYDSKTEPTAPKRITTQSKGNKQRVPDSETTESDAKVNTIDNVLKFVKVVADTITRNTRRSFASKVRYLEDLKDNIMENIEERVESLWPDEGSRRRRRRRGRSAEARGHVEFPSSESALMTISFLTFAIYLIKLVLLVIQTYKNKAMMVTPAVVTAVGRAATMGRKIPKHT